jgi:hypothetical protein
VRGESSASDPLAVFSSDEQACSPPTLVLKGVPPQGEASLHSTILLRLRHGGNLFGTPNIARRDAGALGVARPNYVYLDLDKTGKRCYAFVSLPHKMSGSIPPICLFMALVAF